MWAMPDLRWTTGKKVSFLLDGLKHTATPIAAPFFTSFFLTKVFSYKQIAVQNFKIP